MPARKNSKKRQVILEALAATTAHPTAQELYQQLKPDYPDLSLGTVYRNLSLFSEQGDVMSVGVFRGQERFDARTEPHAHLHCVQCGRVIDVPLPGAPEPQLCTLAQSVTDAQVRRLPVTEGGKLAGVLSIDDIARSGKWDMECAQALCGITANVCRR